MSEQPQQTVSEPDLGKWPRLLVSGDPISETQANEVIVRTTSIWGLHSNDEAWASEVYRALGLDVAHYEFPATDSVQTAIARYRVLDLEHLINARIMSSWIGGPHGWCNWDGSIGCSEYNIGKWPSAAEVDQEWRTIAAAFPFLRLDAQLVSEEGEGTVQVAWRVAGGKVMLRPRPSPRDYLRPVRDVPVAGILGLVTGQPGRERGVSPERLEVALAQVRHTS